MSIKFNDVSYTYSPKTPFEYQALKNISVDLESHKFICLVGQTGSGKSTFMQLINALLIPSSGNIELDNFNITSKGKIKEIKNIRKHAGMVFQFSEYQLFEETVSKDIAFGPHNYNELASRTDEITSNVIKLVGLDESFLEKSPFDLSGGQKRKVAIAGILALEPDVLLLDEPIAGLDPKSTFEMMEMFNKLNKEDHKTIIMICHDMDLVLKYADKVCLFNNGSILSYVTPIELFTNKELCLENKLDLPKSIDLALKLKDKGLNIDINKVKDPESLVNEIKECKK